MRHPSHRHYVILPLLVLGLLGTSAAALRGSSPEFAVTASAGSSVGETFEHSSGMRGILLPGARMDLSGDSPVLEGGSALVTADIPVALQVGTYTLLSIGGGYHVTKSDDAVTVAALTAPILVSVGQSKSAIPAGTQWRSRGDGMPRWDAGVAAWMEARRVTSLPKRFVLEQRESLQALEMPSALPSPQGEAEAFVEAALPELPEALQRRKEQWIDAVLGSLRSRVDVDDSAGVQELLLRPDLAEVFSTVRARAAISTMLFASRRSVALQQRLLPILTADPDLWLLLSLHPPLSTVVWTLPPPEHGPEAQAVRLLNFPFADVGDSAGNAVAWERWEADLLASVLAAEDSGNVAGELIVRLSALAVARDREGYPERARSIAGALRKLGDASGQSLPSEAQKVLRDLDSFDRVRTPTTASDIPSIAAENAAPITAAVQEHFDPALVEAQARDLLRNAGAAFSLETRIIPLSAESVLVEHIVFAGSARDRTLSLTLDAARGEVSAIREGAEEYPYALPLEAFREWIRK